MRTLSLTGWKALWALALLACCLGQAPAQSFTNVPIPNLLGVDLSAAVWGDSDNDGQLDFLIAGYNDSLGYLSGVWQNTGGGFAAAPIAGLPGAGYGSVTWGDYDNDGRLDFLITGTTDGSAKISQLWHNTGSGFTNVPVVGLPGVELSSVAWGDFDNDGRLDFVIAGFSTNAVIQVWRNTGSGFTNVPVPGLPGVYSSSVALGDYDNDGWLDIFITGYAATGRISQLWRNTGSGFTNVPIIGLPGVNLGAAVWGDYDGDGKLDILLTGTTNGNASGAICQLWRNTGSGFTNVPMANVPGVYYGSPAWGDYNNDGRLDFLLTGTTNGSFSGVITELWRNTSNGFVNVPITGLPGVDGGSVAWGDYDNDGRLDFLLTGYTGASLVSQVWRNTGTGTGTANAPPATPAVLAPAFSNTLVKLSWNAPADDHTPASTLSYNLRVGTAPGAGDIVSPQAAANGWRRLPAMGNCQLRTNALLVLPPGLYYWSVQAVDGAFAGSPFSAPQSFTVSAPNAPRLTNVRLNNGAFQFSFTNTPASMFTVVEATNLSSASSNWISLGQVTEMTPGQYQFTDSAATNYLRRFYRVHSE